MRTLKGRLVSVAAAAALAVAVCAPTAGAAGGTWTFGAGPVGVLEAGTALADGRALVLAGVGHCPAPGGHGCSAINSDWLFQPATGTWTQSQAPGFVFQDSRLVPLADGGALLVGGSACEGQEGPGCVVPTPNVYRFDPLSGTWSSARPMREARARAIAVPLGDGRVLVAGGFGGDCTAGAPPGSYSCAPLSSAETYDPTTGEWSAAAPLPHPDGGGAGVELSDGSALVLIPERDGSAAVRFEAATGLWRGAGHTSAPAGAQLVVPPGGRPLALLGGEPYAGFFGSPGTGATAVAPTCDATFAESYAGGEAWVSAPPLAAAAKAGSCPDVAALAGGQVLAAATATTGPRLLDAARLCWSETAPPPAEGPNFLVLGLHDGRGLGTGERGGAYLFTPGPDECVGQPGGGGGPPPRPARFAGVAILVQRSVALVRGRLRVRLSCPAAAHRGCRGTLLLSLRAGRHTIGRPVHLERVFAIGAGASTTVSIRLPRGWSAHLGRRGIRIALTADAREVDGEAAGTRALVAIRR
jgi:hypothetical protein